MIFVFEYTAHLLTDVIEYSFRYETHTVFHRSLRDFHRRLCHVQVFVVCYDFVIKSSMQVAITVSTSFSIFQSPSVTKPHQTCNSHLGIVYPWRRGTY